MRAPAHPIKGYFCTSFEEKVIRMQRKKGVLALVLVMLVGAAFFTQTWWSDDSQVYGQTVLKQGSHGGGVWELQGRLQFLGYYSGQIDGIFGAQTRDAIINFQGNFGLEVDGIAGPKTKNMLWRATRNWQPEQSSGQQQANTPPGSNRLGLSENDISLMANAVYGEARGEPYVGQVAVAAVILNRLNSELFPNTVSGVIFEPRAFTAVSDGQIWLEPNDTARQAVLDAINGMDPTGGCIYYFNPDTATSGWIWTRPQVKQIGKHIFCM